MPSRDCNPNPNSNIEHFPLELLNQSFPQLVKYCMNILPEGKEKHGKIWRQKQMEEWRFPKASAKALRKKVLPAIHARAKQ
jgi:hypothetical protein